MYAHEYEEWHSDVAAITETLRAVACGHTVRGHGTCYDCGESADE